MGSKSDGDVLDEIERYGCHILHILGDTTSPPFSYSIGINKKMGMPDLVIIGLKHQVAHELINCYNRRIQSGERFTPNTYYHDFINNYPCFFERVHHMHYEEYFGWALWLYKESSFEMLQLIYPDQNGEWPNSKCKPHNTNAYQIILTENGLCSIPSCGS